MVHVLVVVALRSLGALASANGVIFPFEKGVCSGTATAFDALTLTRITVVEGKARTSAFEALRLILLNEEDQTWGVLGALEYSKLQLVDSRDNCIQGDVID